MTKLINVSNIRTIRRTSQDSMKAHRPSHVTVVAIRETIEYQTNLIEQLKESNNQLRMVIARKGVCLPSPQGDTDLDRIEEYNETFFNEAMEELTMLKEHSDKLAAYARSNKGFAILTDLVEQTELDIFDPIQEQRKLNEQRKSQRKGEEAIKWIREQLNNP